MSPAIHHAGQLTMISRERLDATRTSRVNPQHLLRAPLLSKWGSEQNTLLAISRQLSTREDPTIRGDCIEQGFIASLVQRLHRKVPQKSESPLQVSVGRTDGLHACDLLYYAALTSIVLASLRKRH